MILALEKAKDELEDKIAHPVGEIKDEFEEARTNLRRVFKEVGALDKKMTREMSQMRDLISQTFHVVLDHRFKVSFEQMLLEFCYRINILRTALKQLMQHTLCSSGSGFQISNSTPSSCKPALPKTSTLRG